MPWRGAHDLHPKARHVVASHSCPDELKSTAGQPKTHRPHARLAAPVVDLVHRGEKDVSFDLSYKYDKDDAFRQLSETKIYSILKGVRGEPPSDVEAILNVLIRISQMVQDFPEIVELDINPLLVFEENPEHDAYSAVDIKITIQQKK